MAGSYTLVGSYSSVQVLGPTSSQAVEVASIQTIPTGVVAVIPVVKREFDAGTAGPLLTTFADNIEAVIGQGKAVDGSGKSVLDDNGLVEYYVTFTVGYDPPGAPPGQVTADVDVPIGLLSEGDAELGATLLAQAEAQVTAAYDNLVSLSRG